MPILRTPAEYGMSYKDAFIPSLDGFPLEARFIPANSDRLIVCNHPMAMNRYKYRGHLKPWIAFNDVEVDFNRSYKLTHRAGYNVLTHDTGNKARVDPPIAARL